MVRRDLCPTDQVHRIFFATNNKPNVIVFATPNFNPQGQGGSYEEHNLGVFYNQIAGKWSILNIDGADMPTTSPSMSW